MENKIKPLPIELQIEGLKHAKGYLESITNYYAPYHRGLCGILCFFIGYFDIEYEEIQEYIPPFTIENAIKYSGGGAGNIGYWWLEDDKESRIKFLDWMISELQKQLTEQVK